MVTYKFCSKYLRNLITVGKIILLILTGLKNEILYHVLKLICFKLFIEIKNELLWYLSNSG